MLSTKIEQPIHPNFVLEKIYGYILNLYFTLKSSLVKHHHVSLSRHKMNSSNLLIAVTFGVIDNLKGPTQ